MGWTHEDTRYILRGELILAFRKPRSMSAGGATASRRGRRDRASRLPALLVALVGARRSASLAGALLLRRRLDHLPLRLQPRRRQRLRLQPRRARLRDDRAGLRAAARRAGAARARRRCRRSAPALCAVAARRRRRSRSSTFGVRGVPPLAGVVAATGLRRSTRSRSRLRRRDAAAGGAGAVGGSSLVASIARRWRRPAASAATDACGRTALIVLVVVAGLAGVARARACRGAGSCAAAAVLGAWFGGAVDRTSGRRCPTRWRPSRRSGPAASGARSAPTSVSGCWR